MAAPSIRSSAVSTRATNATADTITQPATIVDGDILTLIYGKDAAATTLTLPTGFTAIFGTTANYNDGGAVSTVATKTAASESGTYAASSSVAERFSAYMGSIQGTSGINDYNETFEDPSTGSIEAAPVLTSVNDCLILYLITSDDVTGTVSCTSDGGATTLDKQQSQNSGCYVACFYEVQATAGSSAARTFTLNVAQEWVCRTIAFAPPAAAGTAPPRLPVSRPMIGR